MPVLSAAVLVIVIDARDVGLLVVLGARGFNSKSRRARRYLGVDGARGFLAKTLRAYPKTS